jgi:uncharacterized paraquat-inducible protein A
MSSSDTPEVQIGGARLSHGRMPCPNCGAPMELPFDALFTGTPVWCSRCGAKLTVRAAESQEALTALKKAQVLIDEVRRSALSKAKGAAPTRAPLPEDLP